MAAITNRPTKLVIENLEYPGFLSFAGNDSSVGESGIVQFQGTIEIAHHPKNPQSLNYRQNRFWCFGKRIEIWVLNAEKNWVLHPRGGLWIYQPFYDPQNRILNLQCGCLIYILKNRSTSDFEKPEDLIKITEDKVNPETGDAFSLEKEKYWWEQWEKPGVVDIDDIVSEVLQQLKLSKIGKAIGKIRAPWQPSGSLLQAVGELVFKSVAPSYLWCDNEGKIRIEKLPARQGRANVAYTPSGNSATSPGLLWENLPTYEESSDLQLTIGGDRGDEISYKPHDYGEEPIKELLITGSWKIPDPNLQSSEDGYFKCDPYQERGSETLVFPNGEPDKLMTIARGERCEYNYEGKKVIKEWREERRKMVFPDARKNFDKWVRMRESEIVQKFDPLNEDRLYSEEETVKECIGKIYGGWLRNHPNFSVTGIDKASTTYADALTHDAGLQITSKTVTTYSYAPDLSLSEKKITNYEPQSKILESYPIFSDKLQVASQEIEKWNSYGASSSHWKIQKTCWERFNNEEIRKLEKNLYKNQRGKAQTTVAGFKRDGHFEETNTLTPTSITFATPVLTPEQRLALIIQKQPQISSSGNLANPPATEYQAPMDREEAELIDTGGFVLKKWRDAVNCDYEPPREMIDIGEVFSEEVIEAVGEFIYFLRQGRSQAMEVRIPLPEKLTTNYRPLMMVDIVEPTGEIVKFLIDGSSFEIGEKLCVMGFDGLWLGTRGTVTPITNINEGWISLG